MWHDTEFARRLGLAYPIIQGPFGGGLSALDLLVAVSEAGGLGSFGIHHLGGVAIRELDAAIRARTRRPYALNLWVSDHDPGGFAPEPAALAAQQQRFAPYYRELGLTPPAPPARFGERFDEQVEAVLALRPPVFSFVYGVPPAAVLAECRRREIYTLGTATTVDEALLLQAAGVDAVVATGFEAGGHRVSFLRPAEETLTGSLALLPQVADRVAIPVIAAGGIGDGRGIAAALALGAQGVQIGTAFLACEESNASPLHKAALFGPDAGDTALTRAFSGRLARGLRNRLMQELNRDEASLPYPAQGWFAASFKQAALEQGRSDLLALWAGQGAPLLRHRRAAELFAALVADTGAVIGRLVGSQRPAPPAVAG